MFLLFLDLPEGGTSGEKAEDGVAFEETKNRNFDYYLYNKDVQGSTTNILNGNGTDELSYEYDDFGETEVNGNSVFQNEICYTGGIYDETTGLYYLNARYYDPENGRFLTEDTYRGELNEPDTLHLYVYCKNNPINYVDPSGHIIVPALAYYAGVTFITASGMILYYCGKARIRGETFYIYRSSKPKKKSYKATAVMPKTGKAIKSKTVVNKKKSKAIINKSKSKVKSGTASKKESKKSKKERATDIPSWARGSEPRKGESGKEYAKRKMDEHYGKNKWKRKGKQGDEYSQLKKWGDRGH